MSILFTPRKIGNVIIKNRFIHSACEDNLADETGMVTEANIRKMRTLARGEVGLIIWTHLAIHPSGRTKMHQAGIFKDEMIPAVSCGECSAVRSRLAGLGSPCKENYQIIHFLFCATLLLQAGSD